MGNLSDTQQGIPEALPREGGNATIHLYFQGEKRVQPTSLEEELTPELFSELLKSHFGLKFKEDEFRFYFLDHAECGYVKFDFGEREKPKTIKDLPRFLQKKTVGNTDHYHGVCLVMQKKFLSQNPNISHPWLELMNTKFTKEEIQSMSKEEFRFFVLGSRNMKQIMQDWFSSEEKLNVPDQLASDVLNYILITNQLELLEEMFEVRNLEVQRTLFTMKPEIYQEIVLRFKKKHRKNFFTLQMFESCSSTIVSHFLSMVFDRTWEEDFFEDIMEVLTEKWFVPSDLAEKVLCHEQITLDHISDFLRKFKMNSAEHYLAIIETWNRLYSSSGTGTPLQKRVEKKMLKDIALIDHLSTSETNRVLKMLCKDSIAAKFYLGELVGLIRDYVSNKRAAYLYLCENEMLDSTTQHTALFEFVKNERAAVLKLCERKDMKSALLKKIFAYVGQIHHFNFDQIDEIYAKVAGNKHATFTPPEFLRMASFVQGIFRQNNQLFCSCALKLIQRDDISTEALRQLCAIDYFSRSFIAAKRDLDLSVRKILMNDSIEEVRLIAKAYHPDLKVQRGVLEVCKKDLTSHGNLSIMSHMAKSHDLHDDIISEMISLSCKRDWRWKRVLALRKDVTEEQLMLLLQRKDLDIFVNVSLSPLSLSGKLIEWLGNMGALHKYTEFLDSLKLSHKGLEIMTEAELQSMLYSYQSEIRMNLIATQKKNLTKEIISEWVDDPDFGVLYDIFDSFQFLIPYIRYRSAIVSNIDISGLPRVVNSIIGRKANLQTIREDIIKVIVSSFIATEKQLPESMINYSRVVCEFVLSELRKKELQYAHLKATLEFIIENWKRDQTIMKLVSEVFMILPKFRKFPEFAETFNQYALNQSVNVDYIFPLIYFVRKKETLHAILKRPDLKEDHLIKLMVREIHLNGYHGEILKKIALRDNLPQNVSFILCLLQSKLGAYNIFDITDETKDLKMIKNDLLPIFLRKRIPLNQHILKYYLSFEPDFLMKILKSDLMDSEVTEYFFDQILVHLEQNPKHPVFVYLEKFMAALRRLSGCEELNIYDCSSNLTSKLIRDTISFSENGVKFGKLFNFLFEHLGLDGKFSSNTINLFNAYDIIFKEFLKKSESELENVPEINDAAPANPRSDNANKGSGGVEFDYEDSSDLKANSENDVQQQRRTQQFDVNTISFTSFEEMRVALVDLLLSSNTFSYLGEFFEKEFLRYEYSIDGFIVVPKEVAELYNDTFEINFNLRLIDYVSKIYGGKVLEKEKITQKEFLMLLEEDNQTIEKVLEIHKKLGLSESFSNEHKILENLVQAGIKNDRVRNLNRFLAKISLMMEGEKGKLFERITDEVLVKKVPYSFIYEISRLLPLSCSEKFNDQLMCLISFLGKPELVDAEKSVNYFYLRFKEVLDLFKLSDVEFLAGLCRSEIQGLKFLDDHISLEVEIDGEMHRCSCARLEKKMWALLENITKEFISTLEEILNDPSLSISSHEINMKQTSTLQTNGIFHRDVLLKVAQVMRAKEEMVVQIKSGRFDKFLEFISPFKGFIDVSMLMYKSGEQKRLCLFPNCLFDIEEYFGNEIVSEDLKISDICRMLERVEFISKVQKEIGVDRSITINRVEEELKLKSWEKVSLDEYMYLSRDDVTKACSQKISKNYREVITKFIEEKQYIDDRAVLVLLTVASDKDFEEIISYEAIQTGKRTNQHPLKLDENLLPMVDPQNEEMFLRDPTQPKRLLPVMFAKKKVVVIPKMIQVNRELKLSDMNELSCIQFRDLKLICENLKQSFDAEITRIRKMTFTKLNKRSLIFLIQKLKNIMALGVRVAVPWNRQEFKIMPKSEFYGSKIKSLQDIQFISNPKEIIERFQFHKNDSLPIEMVRLLDMIENLMSASDSNISKDELDSKVFLCGLILEVLKSEPNYHDLVDARNTKLLNNLYGQLNRLYTKLTKYQELTKGVVITAFKVTEKGGYCFISSHFDSAENKYRNFLHFSTYLYFWLIQLTFLDNNACANLDFQTALNFCVERIPYEVLNGMRIEDFFYSIFGETIVISISKERLQIIRQTTDREMRSVLVRNAFVQEVTGAGRSAGRMNFYSSRLNHIQKEASLCNASPIVGFEFNSKEDKMELRKSIDEMRKELMELSSYWIRK